MNGVWWFSVHTSKDFFPFLDCPSSNFLLANISRKMSLHVNSWILMNIHFLYNFSLSSIKARIDWKGRVTAIPLAVIRYYYALVRQNYKRKDGDYFEYWVLWWLKRTVNQCCLYNLRKNRDLLCIIELLLTRKICVSCLLLASYLKISSWVPYQTL